jgi:hypothetical protein
MGGQDRASVSGSQNCYWAAGLKRAFALLAVPEIVGFKAILLVCGPESDPSSL